jgi:hypothetical protein
LAVALPTKNAHTVVNDNTNLVGFNELKEDSVVLLAAQLLLSQLVTLAKEEHDKELGDPEGGVLETNRVYVNTKP